MAGIPDFPLFFIILSQQAASKHEAFTLHQPPLASAPQPAGGETETEKESGAESYTLPEDDCKQTGLLMLSSASSHKVSVLLWGGFNELPPQRGPQPRHHPHM